MADASIIDQLKSEIASMQSGMAQPARRAPAKRNEEAPDAFKKIVALFNVSDRSEKATRERLAQYGFPESEIDDAVERAKRYGIIDDCRYAEILIRSRLNQGKGAEGIERELRERGIEIEAVSGWPFEYGIDDESEYQRALRFIESHPTRSKNPREGAFRKLVQKGYATSTAAAAARSWSERE